MRKKPSINQFKIISEKLTMSSVASEEDFACIPGLGENKQKPRKYIFAIDPMF